MKKGLLLPLFLLVLSVTAQKSDSTKAEKGHRFIFKSYPISFTFSQLIPYCSDIQFGLEYFIRKRQSVYFITTASIPKWIPIAFGGFLGSNPYIFFGGRGVFGYRYYVHKQPKEPIGFYIGAEVSIAGYKSFERSDRLEEDASWWGHSSTNAYKAHAIMSNYNFTLGFQNLIQKRKKRRGGKVRIREYSIDFGISIGYRYHYFWREYPQGNLEYAKSSGGLYKYYKTVPVGGSLNFSIGRFF